MTDSLLSLSPKDFADWLKERGIGRFAFTWDEEAGCVRSTHPELQPIADWMDADGRDFARHEGILCERSVETGLIHAGFVHRTCRGQGAGGARYWSYPDMEAVFRDGLRLSRGMTHKNALAGIWWGGGKGIIVRNSGPAGRNPSAREAVFREFGTFITSLRGAYITAEDVGVSVEDIALIHSRTRFVTCVPTSLGGSGNPSAATAMGVVRGIEAALEHIGRPGVAGRSFAVQGLGHVGTPLIEFLVARGAARIEGVDVSAERVAALSGRFPGVGSFSVIEPGDQDILSADVDVVAPCATGASINSRTIPGIRAPIVCGAANNQLEDPVGDAERLRERGIAYLPDFLVNRMGIVNCADEHTGIVDPEPEFDRHLGDAWDNSVFRLSKEVLTIARDTGRTTQEVAVELAEQRSMETNPLYGHRGKAIIRGLIRGGWAESVGPAPLDRTLDY